MIGARRIGDHDRIHRLIDRRREPDALALEVAALGDLNEHPDGTRADVIIGGGERRLVGPAVELDELFALPARNRSAKGTGECVGQVVDGRGRGDGQGHVGSAPHKRSAFGEPDRTTGVDGTDPDRGRRQQPLQPVARVDRVGDILADRDHARVVVVAGHREVPADRMPAAVVQLDGQVGRGRDGAAGQGGIEGFPHVRRAGECREVERGGAGEGARHASEEPVRGPVGEPDDAVGADRDREQAHVVEQGAELAIRRLEGSLLGASRRHVADGELHGRLAAEPHRDGGDLHVQHDAVGTDDARLGGLDPPGLRDPGQVRGLVGAVVGMDHRQGVEPDERPQPAGTHHPGDRSIAPHDPAALDHRDRLRRGRHQPAELSLVVAGAEFEPVAGPGEQGGTQREHDREPEPRCHVRDQDRPAGRIAQQCRLGERVAKADGRHQEAQPVAAEPVPDDAPAARVRWVQRSG